MGIYKTSTRHVLTYAAETRGDYENHANERNRNRRNERAIQGKSLYDRTKTQTLEHKME